MKRRRVKFTTLFAIIVLAVVIIMTLFPSLLTKYDPLALDLDHILDGPSAEHWLGTDEYGRDIMCRIIYGARKTMAVGLG